MKMPEYKYFFFQKLFFILTKQQALKSPHYSQDAMVNKKTSFFGTPKITGDF